MDMDMEKPYVISGEFDLTNTRQQQIIRPTRLNRERASLVNDLQRMGKNVVWVDAKDIADGMQRNLATSNLPVVTLDELYVASLDARIGISRAVDNDLNDSGYVPRVGYGAIEAQFDAAALLGPEIQLADDVVFSGEMIEKVVAEFNKRSVRVGRVVCGIAIKEGVERMEALSIPIESTYVFDEVEDEVCERDLLFSRGSGRRLVNAQQNALYFDPENGRPEQWASIPTVQAESFCIASLERSLNLLQPGVTMNEIGQFYGYQVGGTAESAIRTRIKELV